MQNKIKRKVNRLYLLNPARAYKNTHARIRTQSGVPYIERRTHTFTIAKSTFTNVDTSHLKNNNKLI